MSNSRSNEQIVAEELAYVTDECSCHRSTAMDLARDAVAALEEAGRLVADSTEGQVEPTEAQVEAAAEAIHNLMQGDPSFKDSGRKREMRIYARAALKAAQGAAPQAECDCGAGPGSAVCKKVCATRAPVLPSSGVDEDALAEVIRKLRFDDAGCWTGGIDCTESVSDHADEIARAVAEWLKGQGGESRGDC